MVHLARLLQGRYPEERTWTISYDAGGLPVMESQPGNIEISRVFDELGRLTYEAGIGSGTTVDRSLGYDLAGRLTSVSHPAGNPLTYAYDSRGLMLTADDGAGGISTFAYDQVGRMVSRHDPSGDSVFTWTDRSELNTITDPVTGEVVDYDWTVASQVETVSYGNTGLTRGYVWNDRGLLESDVLRDGSEATVASFDYSYDPDGNVKTEDVVLPGNPQAGSHTYGYDDAGRLTSWTHAGDTVTYGWDGAGNRTSVGDDSFGYDPRNRLVIGPDGTYTYTARGDLATVTDGGTVTTYGFDPLGRHGACRRRQSGNRGDRRSRNQYRQLQLRSVGAAGRLQRASQLYL